MAATILTADWELALRRIGALEAQMEQAGKAHVEQEQRHEALLSGLRLEFGAASTKLEELGEQLAALKAAGATSDNPHSGHQHELHQYPDRPETAKHGYGRCTHPAVQSDVCAWPMNAQRFMQALGVAK